jgi:phosphopantetheinyl transferase
MKRLILTEPPPLSFFTDDELATADAFKLARRRDEWLLSRAAAKQLALNEGFADDPRRVTVERPLLLIDGISSGWYVSVSHSFPYAGAAIDRHPVGFDVQVVREIAEWSSHLFLTEIETEQMRRCAIPHRILHFWCAKEAAFKRDAATPTMKQTPIQLVAERADGLTFDVVETVAMGEVLVAGTI